MQIDLRADIDASPKDTFDVLTTPDNTHIFRNIKARQAFQPHMHGGRVKDNICVQAMLCCSLNICSSLRL